MSDNVRYEANALMANCSHKWKQSPGEGEQLFPQRWECSCMLSTSVPYAALCPDRVSDVLEALAVERDNLRARINKLEHVIIEVIYEEDSTVADDLLRSVLCQPLNC